MFSTNYRGLKATAKGMRPRFAIYDLPLPIDSKASSTARLGSMTPAEGH